MRPAVFTIEVYNEQSFEGFARGDDCNGWACPYFTFEQAKIVLESHRARGWKAWYDEAEDKFVFDFSHTGNETPENFPAQYIEGMKLYPIGAFSWTWEEEFRWMS